MTKYSFPVLTHAMLEQFREFLDKQEALLADALLLATIPAIDSKLQSPLHLHGSGHFRLSQALQVLNTRIRNLHEGKTTQTEWNLAIGIMNKAFWDYVEVLESAVQELFNHMDEVDLNGWSENFYQIATSFKELLAHRIEDLIWVFKRVEEQAIAYRLICRNKKNIWVVFGKFLSRFSSALDKSILNHLSQADESLAVRYKKFSVSYNALKNLIPEIQEKESKFANYSVFMSLDKDKRDLIIKLYRLIALNEKNSKLKTLNEELLVGTVKNFVKKGHMNAILREYVLAIRKSIFSLGISWQKDHEPILFKFLKALEKEVNWTRNLIYSYREILVQNQSEVKWTFKKWRARKEPRKTRDLFHLLCQIDEIKKMFPALELAMEKKGLEPSYLLKRNRLKRQMEEVLHEMGQPLSSRNLIQIKAERLIDLLDLSDELGGSLGDIRKMITKVLLKAMHYDTKYQVLNDYPRFHELFAIHEGLLPHLEDYEHINRLKLFQSVFRHVEYWIQNRKLQEHITEIEIDEAAINESLQELLSKVKRDDKGNKEQFEQMLLTYRYRFSQFFHFLRSFESEGNAIRNQFTFVDRYFDAIENAIQTTYNYTNSSHLD